MHARRATSKTPEYAAEFIELETIDVEAIALLSAKERQLPLLYRIARYHLQRSVPNIEEQRVSSVLSEIGSLESARAVRREGSIEKIRQLLGDYAAGLFIRILIEGPESVRRGTIEGLSAVAPDSADACRVLLGERDRDTAPMVDRLLAEGILIEKDGDWLYGDELLLRAPPSEEEKE